jgi:hypothetical protein
VAEMPRTEGLAACVKTLTYCGKRCGVELTSPRSCAPQRRAPKPFAVLGPAGARSQPHLTRLATAGFSHRLLATHGESESCVRNRKGAREALIGGRTGFVSSRESILSGVPTLSDVQELTKVDTGADYLKLQINQIGANPCPLQYSTMALVFVGIVMSGPAMMVAPSSL